MYQQILNSLRDKYKSLGLSETVLAAMAKQIEAKITKEDEIPTAVGEVEPILKSFQSETDRRVTEAQKAAAKPEEVKSKENENKVTDPDVPKWAQGLIDSNTALQKEISELKGKQTFGTRQSVVEETLKGVPDSFKDITLRSFNRMKFDKDEDFQSYVDELKVDAEKAKGTESESTQAGGTFVPLGGQTGTGGNTDKASKAADEAIKNWASKDKTPEETK